MNAEDLQRLETLAPGIQVLLMREMVPTLVRKIGADNVCLPASESQLIAELIHHAPELIRLARGSVLI